MFVFDAAVLLLFVKNVLNQYKKHQMIGHLIKHVELWATKSRRDMLFTPVLGSSFTYETTQKRRKRGT